MSREPCAGRSQSSDGYKARGETGSLVKMQGLSSRAHAFSVEALVGKPCKRMKVSEGHESSSAGDTGGDTSIFTGEAEDKFAGLSSCFNIHSFYAKDGTPKRSTTDPYFTFSQLSRFNPICLSYLPV